MDTWRKMSTYFILGFTISLAAKGEIKGTEATNLLDKFSAGLSRDEPPEVSSDAHVSERPALSRETFHPSTHFLDSSNSHTRSDYVILHKIITSKPFRLQSESTTLYPFIDDATAMDYFNDYESRPRPKRWPLRILLDVGQGNTEERSTQGWPASEKPSKSDVKELISRALTHSILNNVSQNGDYAISTSQVTGKSVSKHEAHVTQGSTGDSTQSTPESTHNTGRDQIRSHKKTKRPGSRKQKERRNRKGRKRNEATTRSSSIAHHRLAGEDYVRLSGSGPTQAGSDKTQKRDGRKPNVGQRKSKRRTESPGRGHSPTAPTGMTEVSTQNASATTSLPQQADPGVPQIARVADNSSLRNDTKVEQPGLDSDWSLKTAAASISDRPRSWSRKSSIDPWTNPPEVNSHEPASVETRPSKCAPYIRDEEGSHAGLEGALCITHPSSMDEFRTSQRPANLEPVIGLNERPPEKVPTTDTVKTGDKQVYSNVYDFLSNQQVNRRNQQPRKFDAFNREFAEKMCGIFGKRFVPTSIGGKCE